MESSFCIWLARNCNHWSPVPTNPTASTRTEIKSKKKKVSAIPTTSKSVLRNMSSTTCQDKPTSSKPDTTIHPSGFVNKGNTCYANSILQALYVLPALWSQRLSESDIASPLIKSLAYIMSQQKISSKPIDPSFFLRSLQQKISSIRNITFNFNTQQDVPEVLQVVLDEIKGTSPLIADTFTSRIQTTITCDTCCCSSVKEDNYNILSVPTLPNVSSSLDKFFQDESLLGENMWLCPSCAKRTESTKETRLTACGRVLILQLTRYQNLNGDIFKDTKFVECVPTTGSKKFRVPVHIEDSVTFYHEYAWAATINHSGNLHAGHYWALTNSDGQWFKCNDKSVLQIKPSEVNNESCYVFFYVKV